MVGKGQLAFYFLQYYQPLLCYGGRRVKHFSQSLREGQDNNKKNNKLSLINNKLSLMLNDILILGLGPRPLSVLNCSESGFLTSNCTIPRCVV